MRCRSCKVVFEFGGLLNDKVCGQYMVRAGCISHGILTSQEHIIRSTGFVCPNPECCSVLPEASVSVQIETQIRAFIAQFYEGWLLCDDQSCLNRTRQISVYGRRCLRPDCRGAMHAEVSPATLPVPPFSHNNGCWFTVFRQKAIQPAALLRSVVRHRKGSDAGSRYDASRYVLDGSYCVHHPAYTSRYLFRLCPSFRNPAPKDVRYVARVSGSIPGSLCKAVCGHVKFVFFHASVVGIWPSFMYVIVAVNVL